MRMKELLASSTHLNLTIEAQINVVITDIIEQVAIAQ
jgi:hypothetical protein